MQALIDAFAALVACGVVGPAERPASEDEEDAAKLNAGIEENDEDARMAANAYMDVLGVLPVEPHPMPPKPQPDPPGAEAGLDGATQPEAGPGPLYVTENGDVGFEVSSSIGSAPMVQRHGLNLWDGYTRITVVQRAESSAADRGGGRQVLRARPGRQAVAPAVTVGAAVAPAGGGRARGEKAPPAVPPEFAYLGYHVEVEQPLAGWVWKAWRQGKHDGAADLQGGPERGLAGGRN